jgi:hypothetical protein
VVSTARFLARRLSWPMCGRLVVSKLGKGQLVDVSIDRQGAGQTVSPVSFGQDIVNGSRIPSPMTSFAINLGVDHRDTIGKGPRDLRPGWPMLADGLRERRWPRWALHGAG